MVGPSSSSRAAEHWRSTCHSEQVTGNLSAPHHRLLENLALLKINESASLHLPCYIEFTLHPTHTARHTTTVNYISGSARRSSIYTAVSSFHAPLLNAPLEINWAEKKGETNKQSKQLKSKILGSRFPCARSVGLSSWRLSCAILERAAVNPRRIYIYTT